MHPAAQSLTLREHCRANPGNTDFVGRQGSRRFAATFIVAGLLLMVPLPACSDSSGDGRTGSALRPKNLARATAMCDTFAREHRIANSGVAASPATAGLVAHPPTGMQAPPGVAAPKPATKPWAKLPPDHPVTVCAYVAPLTEPTVPTFPAHPTPGQTIPVARPKLLPQYIVDAEGRWSVIPASSGRR